MNSDFGPHLKVLSPGLHTLIVDAGRPRSRRLGVPVGGAADRFSLALGNFLVGNEPDAAALEIALAGPTLEVLAPLACVLFGAPFEMAGDRAELRAGTTFTLEAGDRVRIGGTPEGMRAYLCVQGGIDAPQILGSRSSLEPVQAGDVLRCRPGRIVGRNIGRAGWRQRPENRLRVLPGAQDDWFPAGVLIGRSFEVTPASNRMGLRLRGEALPVPARELVSEPVCPGTVQVTRDGQLIVLGVDGQTIGGYPKVAQVIAADVDALGQLRPGEAVAFAEVTLAEAERLWSARQAELREWRARLG